MSWLKRTTHNVAHKFGSAATKLTGSKTVGKYAEKAVKYATPLDPVSNTYQAMHIAGHVKDTIRDATNPKLPETQPPEMPDYSEYLAMMGEYIAAMNEAMNRSEPAAEPLKQAQVEMSQARADTDRKQLLRRGLMSTYTRYGANGGVQRLGA